MREAVQLPDIIWRAVQAWLGACLGIQLTVYRQHQRGSTSIMFALAAVPLLLSVGAAVDYVRASNLRTHLQGAVDGAALSVAASVDNLDDASIRSRAQKAFDENFSNMEAAAIKLSSSYDRTQALLTLTATADMPTAFMKIAGVDKMALSSLAQVQIRKAQGPCVIALDASAPGAFEVNGAGSVNVPNCGVYVNSSSASAFIQTGNGGVHAQSIKVVGGVGKIVNTSPKPLTAQKAALDPLASLAEPEMPSGCSFTDKTFAQAVSLPAGSVYCGKISLQGNATFEPGIHYFKNASVAIASSATITGDGVMLYFNANSELMKSAGGGGVQLKGMKTGPYKGIAVFGARQSCKMKTFTFTGNKDYFVNGTIYLPAARIYMVGDADLTVPAKSGYVIARQFYYQGSSSLRLIPTVVMSQTPSPVHSEHHLCSRSDTNCQSTMPVSVTMETRAGSPLLK